VKTKLDQLTTDEKETFEEIVTQMYPFAYFTAVHSEQPYKLVVVLLDESIEAAVSEMMTGVNGRSLLMDYEKADMIGTTKEFEPCKICKQIVNIRNMGKTNIDKQQVICKDCREYVSTTIP